MESKLLDLPARLLISRMTYIPFKDVQSLCQTNKRIHDICTNPTYSNDWKKIIDYTYGHTKYYQDLIKAKDLKYDYILYTQLIDSLDPTVQAEIYRRQGDEESYQRVLLLERRVLLLKRIDEANRSGKVLDISYSDLTNPNWITLIWPPSPATGKIHVPGLPIVSSDMDRYEYIIEILGPKYKPYMDKYKELYAIPLIINRWWNLP